MADTTTPGNNTVNRADSMELLTKAERIPERVRRLEQTITGGLAGSGGGGGAPSGPAGGDLTGTYPNPQIAAGTIIDSDVAAANKDGVAATPSMRTLGVGAQQAVSGTDIRLSDPRPPSGAASGDLSGSYPNPQIAAGVIVDADVNSAAAIAEIKLNLATDAAVGVGSRRTLGTGAQQAAAGNDSRFTNARTPTAHASTHQPGGSDAMQVDAAQATGSLRTLGSGAQQAMPGNRIPAGGTSGQALTKNSATDYDLGWSTVAGGTQATLNVTMDTWHVVGAAGEPAFQNSWVNYDTATFNGAGFRKLPDGRVVLKGLVKSGTVNATLFTLPVGYRPPRELRFQPDNNQSTTTDLAIRPDGSVALNSGVNSWLSLEGIEFDTESVLQTASVAAQPLDSLHVVGAAGEPAFAGAWGQYGTGESAVSFRKDPTGRVFIQGSAGGGTGLIFTLPSGYRPAATLWYPIVTSGAIGYMSVASTGAVTLQSGTQPARLDGIFFDTESVNAYATGAIDSPIARDKTQANGTTFGAWTDLGLINRNIVCDGSIIEVNGVWRAGANGAGMMHLQVGMDGVPGVGTVVAYGTAMGVSGGNYLSIPLFGWIQPSVGSHNFRLYGFVSGLVGNCDASQPSFLAWYRRAA